MYRKRCSLLAIIIALICICSIQTNANEDVPEGLYSRSCCIIDAQNGRLLYGKDWDTMYPMASTTKIMTLILALEYGNKDDIVTISPYAASMPEVRLGIKPGENYRLGDMLYALMLESHNDVAVAIAEHISGSVDGFAKLMNQKAVDIGCFDAEFITPNGLDKSVDDNQGNISEHSISAYNLGLIMNYCIKNKEFLDITTTRSYSFANKAVSENKDNGNTYIDGKRRFTVNNKNAFLDMVDGVMSGKTGFTGQAGYCYVCSIKCPDNEGKERVFTIVTLAAGWPPNKNYKWSDVKKLLKYGEKNYQYRKVYSSEPYISEINVNDGINENIWTSSEGDVELLLSNDDKVEIKYNIPQTIDAPVECGDIVGEVNVIVNGDIYEVVPVKSIEKSQKRDFSYWKNIVIERFLF